MEKINSEEGFHSSEGIFSGDLRYDEPMSSHTTFKVGGNADAWVRPEKDIFPDYAAKLLASAREEGISVFVLGGGANIVVSDSGIRGIVLDTGLWDGVFSEFSHGGHKGTEGGASITVKVLSGSLVDGLADRLAALGLSGLEFLAGLPGTVGGAVWMNARCYEKSISDALIETEILDGNFQPQIVPFCPEDFSYKKSPFQGLEALILSARFAVRKRRGEDMRREMMEYRRDRVEKGHYRFPSAGSAFKNSHSFGEPTGRIVDQVGLRGLSIGGAQVAPWHGNIIINTGNATACDIKNLMDEVSRRVRADRGFNLESEILFVGEWDNDPLKLASINI